MEFLLKSPSFSIRMCLTVDQIEQACGFVLLNEYCRFVYCCKKCHCEYGSGLNLEEHILSEHLDDKSHIESLFVDDGILVEDCTVESILQNSAAEAKQQISVCNTEKEPQICEWIDQRVEEKCEHNIEFEAEIENKAAEEREKKKKTVEETKIKQKSNKEMEIGAKRLSEMIENEENFQEEEKNSANGSEFNAEVDHKRTFDSDEESCDSMIDRELAKVKPKKPRRRKGALKEPKPEAQSTTDPSSKRMSPAKQVYYCDMCPDITLSTFNILQAHMRRHRDHRFRTKKCQICNKKARDLEKHMRMNHMEKKPYKCDFCDNRYRTNNNRLNHMRVHTQERPFLCDQCGIFFLSIFHLF